MTRLIPLLLSLTAAAEDSRRLEPPPAPSRFRPCVREAGGGIEEPDTLEGLVRCHERFRVEWARAYEREKGRPPPDERLDELVDRQKSEVREYLSRHPDRARTEDAPPRPRSQTPPGRRGSAAAGEAARGRPASRCPRADFADMEAFVRSESDGGRASITPEAGRAVVEFLSCQQGYVSGEMRELLDRVTRDGPRLRHDTMLRLKRAARAARGRGLDLGVEAGLERWLLDPATDPPDDPSPSSR